jgi:undecaprenyl-diphosphatase
LEESAKERRPPEDASAQKTVEKTGTIPPDPPAVTGNSMPSAHAANWFAATMVALVYFRKSIRFLLPIACLVSFSRVYNGVHYPSDVLAGAFIGAGHAVAMLWLLNTVWQYFGPKWFTRAYASRPSLTSSTPTMKSQS